MDLRQMKCFIAVADTKSFTEAAEKTFVSQPAISRQIAGMESEIGVQLFKRTKRTVELTKAGEVMYEAFQTILRTYELSSAQALQYSQDTSLFKIGIAHYIPLYPLPASFQNFLNHPTDFSFSVEYASHRSLIESLKTGRYNAIITLDKALTNVTDIEAISLVKVPVFLIYSSELIAGKESQGLAALNGATFFIPETSYLPLGAESCMQICDKLEISYGKIKHVNDTPTMMYLAQSGQGVILLDKFAFHTLRGQDTSLLSFPAPIYHEYMFAYSKNEHHPALKGLIDVLNS